ncbi:hypothetical protein [Actinacidiphila paucisporea]|nr:hypothetical protein [Actinacidiphila paucisporea]
MTDGPGQQQPPQEPRSTTDGAGEREVLEGRVIPSRPQPERDADPRRQFHRQAPPPQAPSPGPAWSPQAEAAAQPGPPPQAQGGPWAPAAQQPALDPTPPQAPSQGPSQEAAPRVAPAQEWGRQPFAAQPPVQQPPVQPPPAQQYAPPRQQGPARHAAPAAQPQAPRGRTPQPEAGTPDWGALAEQQEATGARRRRVLMLTGGIVAVAVIAGAVATAVVMSGKSSDDKPVAGPSSSAGTTASQPALPPAPSLSSVAPPPPANPLDYLSTAAKDKAPLTPDSLFPGKQFVWQGRTYVKAGTDVTTACAKNARKAVATALTANGCQKLVRATYTQGGLAVTVGVAVFPDDSHAKKVGGVSQYLAPLDGGGVADFCHAVRCQMTANSVGRYAYFAIAGFKNGTTLAANDTVGKQAANDASDFAFARIVQRGKDAAAADPTRQ